MRKSSDLPKDDNRLGINEKGRFVSFFLQSLTNMHVSVYPVGLRKNFISEFLTRQNNVIAPKINVGTSNCHIV